MINTEAKLRIKCDTTLTSRQQNVDNFRIRQLVNNFRKKIEKAACAIWALPSKKLYYVLPCRISFYFFLQKWLFCSSCFLQSDFWEQCDRIFRNSFQKFDCKIECYPIFVSISPGSQKPLGVSSALLQALHAYLVSAVGAKEVIVVVVGDSQHCCWDSWSRRLL